jgi:hypothetical protein
MGIALTYKNLLSGDFTKPAKHPLHVSFPSFNKKILKNFVFIEKKILKTSFLPFRSCMTMMKCEMVDGSRFNEVENLKILFPSFSLIHIYTQKKMLKMFDAINSLLSA